MIDNINAEQYNHPIPVQIEHQIKNNYNSQQQQQTSWLKENMNLLEFNDEAISIFLNAINTLEIPTRLAIELLALYNKNIFLIIDDSQSMSEQDTQLYEDNSEIELTRMEELKIRLKSIAPILCTLTKFDINIRILSCVGDPITIYANLPAKKRLEDFNNIIETLKPKGQTPLIAAITSFAQDIKKIYSEKKTTSVLYIFTDGEPNDAHVGSGKIGVDGFIEALHSIDLLKKRVLSIGISACTGDENSIGWLTRVDQDKYIGKAINVQDDFFSEAQSMYYSHGNMIPFNNYGFYIATGLLAPIVPWIDNLNENKTLKKEELSILINKAVSDSRYSEYLILADKARKEKWFKDYMSWWSTENNVNFELKIVTIDGKTYRRKTPTHQDLYLDSSGNPMKIMFNNIYRQCNIL